MPAKDVYPDLVELVGGVEPIVERARLHLEAGEELKALRLLDVAKTAGTETADALALRVSIYEKMLARSVETYDNMSESGILRATLEATRGRLEERASADAP